MFCFSPEPSKFRTGWEALAAEVLGSQIPNRFVIPVDLGRGFFFPWFPMISPLISRFGFRSGWWILCFTAFLLGCATGTGPAAPTLESTNWKLLELNGKEVPGLFSERPILFQLDGAARRVSGSSGVNRFAGNYEIAGKRIKLGPLMGTRMAGVPEAMDFETAYLTALDRVDEWSITDRKLELRAGQEILAVYLPVPAPAKTQ